MYVVEDCGLWKFDVLCSICFWQEHEVEISTSLLERVTKLPSTVFKSKLQDLLLTGIDLNGVVATSSIITEANGHVIAKNSDMENDSAGTNNCKTPIK